MKKTNLQKVKELSKKQKIVVFALLLAVLLPLAAMLTVRAADFIIEIGQNGGGNDLDLTVQQYNYTSDTMVFYETAQWWMFPDYTGAGTNEEIDSYSSLNGIQLSGGTLIKTTPENPGPGEVFHETYRFDAKKIIPQILEWVEDDDLEVSRDDLRTGLTLYVNRGLRVIDNGRKSKIYYNGVDIGKYTMANGWQPWVGNVIMEQFFQGEECFDIPVHLSFDAVNLSVEFIDTKGNPVGGFSCKDNYDGYAYYGETIDFPAFTGENPQYTYKGYEWSDTGKGGTETDPAPKEVDYNSIKKSKSPEQLTLSFIFEKKTEDFTVVTESFPKGAGITTGDGTYDYGERVKITATAKEGYTFEKWSISYKGERTFTVSSKNYSFSMPLTDVYAIAIFKSDKLSVITQSEPENGGTTEGGGEYKPGEEVTITAKANEGYKFTGWSLSTGVSSSNASYKFTMPEESVIATATFEEVEPTPEPEPDPRITTNRNHSKIYHWTTNEGHNIWTRFENESFPDHNGTANVKIADMFKTGITSGGVRKREYEVLTDSRGNEWYCLTSTGAQEIYSQTPYGTMYYYPNAKATYVHPKTYNGYEVDSTDIKYITELEFPDKFTVQSPSTYIPIEYKVTSIGGAGAYFYSGEYNKITTKDYPKSTVESGYGWQLYGTASLDIDVRENVEWRNSVSYSFGVIGNGSVTGLGTEDEEHTASAHHDRFVTEHHVYNTTLRTVIIPSTVETITASAFENCQALNSIIVRNGNLTTLGSKAFSVLHKPTSTISVRNSGRVSLDGKVDIWDDRIFYYYNGSYSLKQKTAGMLAWENRMKIKDYMLFPDVSTIPKLRSIGSSCFANRTHLSEVYLPESVAEINSSAFKNCLLDYINIPSGSTMISGNEETLGTKGDIEDKTIIETPAGSTAMTYGFTHWHYYKVKSGMNVTYYPNGGVPDKEYSVRSELEYAEASFTDEVAVVGGYAYYLDKRGTLIKVSIKTLAAGESMADSSAFTGAGVGGTESYTFTEILSAESYATTGARLTLRDKHGDLYVVTIEKPKNIPGTFTISKTYTVPGTPVRQSQIIASHGFNTKIYEERYGRPYGINGNVWGKVIITLGSDGTLTMTNPENHENPGTFPLAEGITFTKAISLNYPDQGVSVSDPYTNTMKIYALDAEGYLWYGHFSLSLSDSDKFKVVESGYSSIKTYERFKTTWSFYRTGYGKRYLDMSYAVTSNGSGGSGSYGNEYGGTTESGASVTESGVALFLLDEYKNVYYLSRQNYYKMSGGYGITDGSGNIVDSGSFGELKYYDVSPTLTYVTYQYPVDYFLDYPLYMDTSGNIRNLCSVETTYDIFSGAYFAIDIQSCKFRYAGMDFSSWNRAANGTGAIYNPGEHIEIKSYDIKWATQGGFNLYAQWTGETEKTDYIHYNANGGGGAMESTEIPPTYTSIMVTLAENKFIRQGYKFNGWNTKKDGSGIAYEDKATNFMNPNTNNYKSESVTVYAQWIPNTYTLQLASDWETKRPVVLLDEAILTYNDTYPIPGKLTGKNLLVEYDLNTNTEIQSTASSAKFTVESNPFDRKYTEADLAFEGWYLYRNNLDEYTYLGRSFKAKTGNILISGLSRTDGDILTLFPKWGSGYVELPSATMNGYILEGFMNTRTKTETTKLARMNYFGGISTYIPQENETLYASWIPNRYKVTLVSDFEGAPVTEAGGTTGDTEVWMTFDAECPEVEAPVLNHYVFMGYYTELDENGVPTKDSVRYYGETDKTTGKASAHNHKLWQIYDGSITTLYAYWVPDKAIKYEPNYTPLDADCPESFTEYIDAEQPYVTLTANSFFRTGYTWTEWNSMADGTGIPYADRAKLATSSFYGVVPMYARWKANEYRLLYDLKGNRPLASTEPTMETPPAKAVYDVAFTVKHPMRKGYTFLGWNVTGMDNCTHVYDGVTTKATVYRNLRSTDGDVTFTAQWKEKEYDVILDDRGATSTGHTESVHMVFDKKGPSIIVPEKTGYTFHGYHTGTRGTGTKYYDESGICIKTWTEEEVYVLYAYWVQDEIELPDIGGREEPVPLPETEVEGSVGRTDAKGLFYADDYNASTGALTDLQPYLTYDTPASEGAIPGTEDVAFRARMGSWMLNYKFHRFSGKDSVRIYVTVPYITQYEKVEDEELVISEVKKATYAVVVPKAWSYWEVMESGMYYPDKVTVTNAALKDGSVTVDVTGTGPGASVIPSYGITNHGEKEQHVFWDEYDTDGMPLLRIELEEVQYIISGTPGWKPNVTPHLTIVCENAAWADNRQASVRSDRYILDGITVLSDERLENGNGAALNEAGLSDSEDAVSLTSYTQAYKSGIRLEEYRANGTYTTTAVMTYKGDASNVGAAPFKEVALSDVNDLKIHTPVACTGVAVNGIGTENGENTIVLKEALNFFTLRVDNTGTHLLKLGYGNKDFRTALSGRSNVAEKDGSLLNQVKFPFDVYVDNGNNSLKPDGTYDTTGDYYFEAGTWLIIGSNEQQFYVPVTQKNGTFQIEFRSIAINCITDWTDDTQVDRVEQSKVNTNSLKYIATDCMEIKIKSYLKDFKITHTNDPTALKQLRDGCQALTLKKGYEFSYEVLTQGEFYGEHSEIEVTPSYYWISKDETKRQKAEVYRLRQIPDKEWKECYAWESEPLLEKFENWECILQRWCGSGAIPSDILCIVSDTRQGDCMKCKERRYVSGEQVQCEICKSSLLNVEPFSLEEYVSMQTLTGKEEFFKQEGYLMIHFEIRIKSEEKVWYTFDEWRSTELAKDALAAGWRYITGDIIRYDLSAGMADDYEIGGME